MQQVGINFDEYDIDRDARAKAEVLRVNPRGSVPTLDVGGEVLIGWSSSGFESALNRAARERAGL